MPRVSPKPRSTGCCKRWSSSAANRALYEQGNRADLAQQESEEIAVIESFLPRQLDEGEIEAAAKAAIEETGGAAVKDLGKVMAALRERHAGVLDLGRAGAIVRRLLG